MKKRSRIILGLFGFLLVMLAGLIDFVFFTARGAQLFLDVSLSRQTFAQEITIERLEGNLWHGISLFNVDILGVEGLPRRGVLKVQQLDISASPWNIHQPTIRLRNARLKLPYSHPIAAFGSFQKGMLNIGIYSKEIAVEDVLGALDKPALSKISGYLTEVDLAISGTLRTLLVEGTFHIDKLKRYGFSLEECLTSVNLKLGLRKSLQLSGDIGFDGGTLYLQNSFIQLEPGKVFFTGDPQIPSFDLRGNSRIEATDIHVFLKGNVRQPDLKLTSDPPLPQEGLLFMLATGKSWKVGETSDSEKQLSLNLVRDFLEYAFFGGRGGVSFPKNVELTYGLKETDPGSETPTSTHELGAEVRVTDHLSLEAVGELPQDPQQQQVTSEDEATSTPQHRGKILLRYRRRF